MRNRFDLGMDIVATCKFEIMQEFLSSVCLKVHLLYGELLVICRENALSSLSQSEYDLVYTESHQSHHTTTFCP